MGFLKKMKNKAQVNKLLLAAIVFALLVIVLVIFVIARKGEMGSLIGALPSGP